jgi:cytochrome c553
MPAAGAARGHERAARRCERAEFNDIARFYARQVPARATTPTVGDAAAGRNVSVPCAGCHGQQGVAASPIPSLAGQDAAISRRRAHGLQGGSRTHAIMTALSRGLDETTINNLAGYYSRPAPAAAPLDSTPAPAAKPRAGSDGEQDARSA